MDIVVTLFVRRRTRAGRHQECARGIMRSSNRRETRMPAGRDGVKEGLVKVDVSPGRSLRLYCEEEGGKGPRHVEDVRPTCGRACGHSQRYLFRGSLASRAALGGCCCCAKSAARSSTIDYPRLISSLVEATPRARLCSTSSVGFSSRQRGSDGRTTSMAMGNTVQKTTHRPDTRNRRCHMRQSAQKTQVSTIYVSKSADGTTVDVNPTRHFSSTSYMLVTVAKCTHPWRHRG